MATSKARAALAVSLVALAAVLGLVFIASGSLDPTLAPVGSGGREAAVALLFAFAAPAFVGTIRFVAPTWVAWLAGGLSAVLAVALWALVAAGLSPLAWSLYGGLHVLRGAESFSDLGWVLRWLDCSGCAEQNPNYGSTLLLLKAPLGWILTASHQAALGVIGILAMSAALVWLALRSAPVGRLVLLAVSFSGAWLLLLDRANLDEFAILVPVLAVLLLRRWDRLWTWWVVAGLVFVLGTWKYYPFALGLLLLPALRLRRGWTVVGAYAVAAAVFMLTSWESFRRSADTYATFTVVEDFPAVGRIPIVVRMVGGMSPLPTSVAVIVLGLLVLAVAWWGWCTARACSTSPTGSFRQSDAVLALAGSGAFLASCFVGGFGFAYKVAFLLLSVPMLARLTLSGSRIVLYSGLVMAVLIVIPHVVNYRILTASLASLIVGSFALGLALAATWRVVRPVSGSRDAWLPESTPHTEAR